MSEPTVRRLPRFGARVWDSGLAGRVSEVFPGERPTLTIRWADGSFGSYDLDDIEQAPDNEATGQAEWRIR